MDHDRNTSKSKNHGSVDSGITMNFKKFHVLVFEKKNSYWDILQQFVVGIK